MQEFFIPLDTSEFIGADRYAASSYGKIVNSYMQGGNFPSLENIQLAILGVEEDRQAINNEGCGLAADYVRENFYK